MPVASDINNKSAQSFIERFLFFSSNECLFILGRSPNEKTNKQFNVLVFLTRLFDGLFLYSMTRPDSEHQNLERHVQKAEETPRCWMSAIILCTKPGSVKHTEIVSNLAVSEFGHAPVIPMTPHKVAETEFNHFTTRAHLVAAIKTLLAPEDPGPMVQHTTGDNTIFQIGGREPVIVANDVMLDIRPRGGMWLTYNKPDPTYSRDEILAMLTSMVSPTNADLSGTIDARIRVGAAAFCRGSKRGIAGTTKRFIAFEPLDTELIKQYMNDYPTPELLKTNAALRWEHPILKSRIRSINETQVGDPGFPNELDVLLRQAQGSLPEIGSLLTQVNRFRLSGATGQLHEVPTVARNVLPSQDVGSWGIWYT